MEGNKTYRSLVDRLEGDKIVWLIVLILILFSIVCMFSSTSRLLEEGQTRLDMVWSQLKTVAAGLLIIILLYQVGSVEMFRKFSRWGFVLSLFLLLMLVAGPRSGPIRSIELNGARRAMSVFGKQVFIYEMVKVLMVLYIAWTIDAVKHGETRINRVLAEKWSKWWNCKFAKELVYIYIPFIITFVLVMPGSNTAALFIAFIMFMTLCVAGSGFRELSLIFIAGLASLLVCWGIYELSDHQKIQRIGTAISRLQKQSVKQMEQEYLMAGSTAERQKVLDDIRQPYSALIAIHEGGVLGKGPGQSTQRYVVPDISEDYMFSFIVEEYGILGAFIIICLYITLLARGSIIARNCGNDLYAKTAVAGIILLISLQAFLHICVNVRIGPMTGQTLPLISHGKSAFLSFCFAFGVLLSLSKAAQKRAELEEQKADPLVKTEEQ